MVVIRQGKMDRAGLKREVVSVVGRKGGEDKDKTKTGPRRTWRMYPGHAHKKTWPNGDCRT